MCRQCISITTHNGALVVKNGTGNEIVRAASGRRGRGGSISGSLAHPPRPRPRPGTFQFKLQNIRYSLISVVFLKLWIHLNLLLDIFCRFRRTLWISWYFHCVLLSIWFMEPLKMFHLATFFFSNVHQFVRWKEKWVWSCWLSLHEAQLSFNSKAFI